MNDKSAFQRDILFVIYGLKDPKGLKIKDTLEDYYQQEVNHGRLYPNLDELVSDGLVNKGTKDRRTNEYQITDRGREILQTRLEWELDLVDSERPLIDVA